MRMALKIIVLLLCLGGAAFAAGIETGILALNRLRLQHQLRRRVPGAKTIRFFLSHPDILLSTTLIATNLLQVAAAVAAASIGYALGGAWGASAAGILLTLGVLVCCEYIPKAWFQASPSTRVLRFAPLLRVMAIAVAPLVWIVNGGFWLVTGGKGSAKASKGAPDGDKAKPKVLATREELLYLAKEGVQSGVLTPQETEMIHGVFDLPHKTCASLMVPKDKMVTVQADMGVPEFLAFARAHDISRYPVFDAGKKAFVGVVHVLDVVGDETPGAKTVADYMRAPQLVASYLPVDHLLPRMRVTRLPLFLVTDERYEVVGLITLEDVLEEIVGE